MQNFSFFQKKEDSASEKQADEASANQKQHDDHQESPKPSTSQANVSDVRVPRSGKVYRQSLSKIIFNYLQETEAYAEEMANVMTQKYEEPEAKKLAFFNLMPSVKSVRK